MSNDEVVSAISSDTTLSVIKPVMLAPIVNLPPEYHQALGAIAAKWAWLENQIGALIREGFTLDKKEGRLILGGMGMKPKCSVLRIMALKWVNDPKLQRELTSLAKDCQKKIDDRNKHVHGLWAHPAGNPKNIGLAIMNSGEQRVMPEFQVVPLAQLQGIVSELQALQTRAQAATDRIKGRLK